MHAGLTGQGVDGGVDAGEAVGGEVQLLQGGKAAVSEKRATASEGGASQRPRTVNPSCGAKHALVQQ